jgi:hypothetical protein
MTRVLYEMLRVANAVGKLDQAQLRAALASTAAMFEAISRIASNNSPLSYALPLTGDAMAPLFNAHLMSAGASALSPGTAASNAARETLIIRRLNALPTAKLPYAMLHDGVNVDDVVVIQDPNDERRKYVRRVAALEGAEMVSEDESEQPFRIPPDHCWVLRDNSAADAAPDSTIFGALSLRNILGRVMYSIKSATDHGRVANSTAAMLTDSIVLAQEPVVPHVEAHGLRARSAANARREEDSSSRSDSS